MRDDTSAERRLVDHYSEVHGLKSDFRNRNLFEIVTNLVDGENVVDVGCGAAFLANILREKGKNVFGIEPSAGMRALATEANPDVTVVAGSAEDIAAILQEPVDAVVMADVLEHIKDDVGQVKKIHSVLTDKGEFVFVVPAHPLLYGKRDREMGHYRRYTERMLREILENQGFRIVHLRHWNALGFLPYLISEKILRKPLDLKSRSATKSGVITSLIQKALDLWLRVIENRFDFGFGLSIIGVARKE